VRFTNIPLLHKFALRNLGLAQFALFIFTKMQADSQARKPLAHIGSQSLRGEAELTPKGAISMKARARIALQFSRLKLCHEMIS
jgi:hypothetical protein